MKAMIFAAGLGTRLKPITDHKPKALVEMNGITLLEHTIRKLIQYGYYEIIINIHHYPQQIKDFLIQKNNFGISIALSDESEELLETGGGLKKASWFFDTREPFLVYNVDIFSDIDLENMLSNHIQSNAIATLAVKKRETSRYLLFNNEMQLCGWKNNKTNETKIVTDKSDSLNNYAFSGIQILNPGIFDLIKETGKFSIIDVYLRLAIYHKIYGYEHNTGYWFDLGNPESINNAEAILKRINNE